MMRDVDACPHRRPLPATSREEAECRLLREITRVEDPSIARIGRDACMACCDELPPDATGLNPTLASLIYMLARRISEGGGVPGCSAERAGELIRLAEGDLALRMESVGPTVAGSPIVASGFREPDRPTRVGLIGWNTPSGLGHLNRDLARHLPVDRWLIPTHPVLRELEEDPACSAWRGTRTDDLRSFLAGIDTLLFCEHPYIPSIVPMAREMGVRVACIPMWEYLDEMTPWVRVVDQMICPTRICFDVVRRLRERLGLDWDVESLPWPIDIDRFPFRPRTVCERFLFVNGNGGAREAEPARAPWDGRKGVGVIAATARLAPKVPILIRTQLDLLPPLPANVEVVIGDVHDPADLYGEGDVCVQPSRWEGLGLSMLECQASGLPLVTTDAPPMNEHRPIRVARSTASRARLFGVRTIPSHEVDPADLARVLTELHGSDIEEASRDARRFVETRHSWASAGARLLQILRPETSRTTHDRG